MRFDIVTDRPRTRFEVFRLSNSGTTVTAQQGINDASFALASSAVTISNSFPFRTAPFVFTSVGSSVAGGYATSASVAKNSQVVTSRAANASAADGLVNILEVGWDTNLTAAVHPASMDVKSNIGCYLDVFHVKGTGTAALTVGGNRGTLTDNGTGSYTLTLRDALPSATVPVFGQAIGATCAVANIDIASATSLTCKTYNASGSAADSDFYVWIFRPYNKVPYGRSRTSLSAVYPGARLHYFQIDVTGGAPALTFGPKGATVTDNGTGDFTLTLAGRHLSKRAPIVLLGGGVKNTVGTATTSTVPVKCFDAGGSAADPSVPVYGMVMCFDSIAETW